MREYATEQRRKLFDFFKENSDSQFTIEEVAERLCTSKGISISAIYRNVNKLVADGSVTRFAREGSRTFLYQYVGDTNCKEHLHMKCIKCGQIFHMEDETMSVILKTVQKSNFEIDKMKTILYGSCLDCI